MMEIDKAYYIQETELAVLLSMTGQTELYGYPLHDISCIDEAAVHQMLFDMAGRGVLDIRDGKISISGEWQEIIKRIAGAGTLIVSADAGQQYGESFIYLSSGMAVVIHTQWRRSGVLRVEPRNAAAIPEQILQQGIRPDSLLQGMELPGKEDAVLCNMDMLRERADVWFLQPLPTVLEEQGVISAIVCYDVAKHRKMEQIIVFVHKLDNCISVSDERESRIYLYSVKKFKELICGMTGGGIQ